MKKVIYYYITLIFLIFIATSDTIISQETVKERVFETYKLVAEAEKEGADVTQISKRLDTALQLIIKWQKEGDEKLITQAVNMLDEIKEMLPSLIEEGKARMKMRMFTLVAFPLTSVLIGLITYIYGPKLVWRLWLKYRKDWKVKRR